MRREKLSTEAKLQNVKRDEETGCIRWQQAHNWGGYGLIHVGQKVRVVHRVAYELWVGPIPEGYEVDHVRARGCQYRDCINPDHLEAVTKQENRARVVQGCQRADHEHRDVQIKGRPARRCVTCQTAWQRAKRDSAKAAA